MKINASKLSTAWKAFSVSVILSVLTILASDVTHAATIYITNNTNSPSASSIVTYSSTTANTPISNPLIGSLNQIYAITLDNSGNLYTGSLNASTGSINKYLASSGATVTVPLVNVNATWSLATSGGFVYQVGITTNIQKYDTSGTLQTATFLTSSLASTNHAMAIDAANNIMYVSSYAANAGSVASYNLTTGNFIATVVSGATLGGAYGIALDGAGNLFIGGANSNTIGKYNIAGNSFTPNFIGAGAGLTSVQNIAVFGTDIYIVQNTAGKIGKYDTTSAVGVNNFITGLTAPEGIAFSPVAVPEPSSVALVCLGGAAFLGWTTRRRFRKIA